MRHRNTGQRTGLLMLLLSALLVVLPLAAYGDGGDGSGNTQGVFKPLSLVSATLDDGTSVIDAENVSLKPKITMHFDKNVVYLIYWERNKRCFHLYDENGNEKALNLSKIDDTVDFSKRQYIWVEPATALSPGTNYKLYVAPDLLAKNGGSTLSMSTNNRGVTIEFKTAGEKKANNTGSVVSTGSAPAAAAAGSERPSADQVKEQSNATVEDTAESGVTVAANQNNEVSPGGAAAPSEADTAKVAAFEEGLRVQNEVAVGAGILLVGWVAVEVLRRKRKKG
ncbi:hypothetical protein Psch_02965 [Pelotomaculum schinkii]|uniref:SbsA Ig-like domain-containing protein n=1 Tax=Pelotomaculum schinkii TaxID=78350 RepID=A0A4Y7RB35_9FIRM|nr:MULTISPECIES: hypothetical protein [Pelotomaculum]TEB05923.1 hypothetical protein Psch_02965 [Pelotomaculum schinkii]TEB14835.1 hypothetical protein Psfp_02607 [Pelotomaculum sp. FP]